MDTSEHLKHDLAELRHQLTVARANHDHEQIVLLQLDIATVQKRLAEQQRAEA